MPRLTRTTVLLLIALAAFVLVLVGYARLLDDAGWRGRMQAELFGYCLTFGVDGATCGDWAPLAVNAYERTLRACDARADGLRGAFRDCLAGEAIHP